ncbi:MAG: hypothetical protein GY697_06785 [Desulfobacterales bacterium]|nr:hypothetical protein [Desulfobacterales bacterium]
MKRKVRIYLQVGLPDTRWGNISPRHAVCQVTHFVRNLTCDGTNTMLLVGQVFLRFIKWALILIKLGAVLKWECCIYLKAGLPDTEVDTNA